jgi:phospholipid/cholesterol/gamma-HCH transport system substrate-binding protein
MTVQRISASAALVAALVAVAVLMFAPGGGRTYHLHFTHAGLLVDGASVVIGGQKAGGVTDIGLTGAGEADVTIELDRSAPRLRAGTTASLEEPSLSGQANRYIAVSPGPDTAPELPEGAAIASGSTTSVVELDELYNLLDKRTRDGLRNIIRGQRDAYAGRETDAERFYETFAPALQASDRLFRELASDGGSLRRFTASTAELARTLHSSSDDLYGAVEQSAVAVDGFARASTPLERAIADMPSTFAEGRRGFAAIRRSLPAFERLLGEAPPRLRGLPAFSRALEAALRDERSLAALAALLRGPGARDDLVELMAGLPELSRRALPSFAAGRPALRRALPLVDQLRAYTPDLVSLWGNTGRALAPYDANGHYARVMPNFGKFGEDPGPGGTVQMGALGDKERLLGIRSGVLRRCPGSASTLPADCEPAP